MHEVVYNRFSSLKWMAMGAVLVAATVPTYGQALMRSQIVRCTNAIVDEFSNPLRGTDPGASVFGITPEQGALVQILMSENGVIYPPLPGGNPDPRNPLLSEAYMGRGVNPLAPHSGKFSAAVSPRPPFGTRIFVRVFNRPTIAASSFYKDSQTFLISSTAHEVFNVQVDRTASALDTGDNDGDGVNNSWEKSLATDPDKVDSDGDTISDLQELIAGSDPANSSSYIEVGSISYLSDDSLSLAWDSVTGRLYHIESGVLGDLDSGFSEIAQKAGAGGTMSHTISGVDASMPKWYRIKVEATMELPYH